MIMNMVERARNLAKKAHKYQVRQWGGEPYITHPLAVAKAVKGKDAITVALLHDVVEDTDVTLDDLREEFPERVVEAVDRLTKREEETYFEFVERAMDNPLARIIKIADIEHNMSTIPEGHGLRDRWEKALIMLGKENK